MEKKKVLHQPTIVFQGKTKEFKKCFHTKEARIEETKVRTHKKQSNNFLLGGKWFFKYYKKKRTSTNVAQMGNFVTSTLVPYMMGGWF